MKKTLLFSPVPFTGFGKSGKYQGIICKSDIQKPSPRSNLNEDPSAHVRHFEFAQGSTAENIFWLSTHPCRTPALI